MATTTRTTTGTTEPGVSSNGPMPSGLRSREAALVDRLSSLPSVLVAYSGGVDSAYLAWSATRLLGRGAVCVTGDSPSYPGHHREMAIRLAREFRLQHEIIPTRELETPAYRANDTDRCYHCKHELYSQLTRMAADRGIPAVADGSNADDRGDYRPGRRAAREFGVLSPLDEAGLTKADIRWLSREAGLPTWDEPASACLASRVPYHSDVTPEKLRAIEDAESAIRALGFRVVRVRHHGAVARLELAREEMARALEPDVARAIDHALRHVGFQFVTLDLRGYRTGSLNEGLRLQQV